LFPRLRPVARIHRRRRCGVHQQLARERQPVGILAPRVLPPAVEVGGRHHVGRHPLGVERVQPLVVDQDVPPPRAVLERLDLLDQRPVGVKELVPAAPLALHQRPPDEQLAREHRVDPAVLDRAVGDDREPIQRHPLGRHDRPAARRPAWLRVRALQQMARQRLDPPRVHARDRPPPQPRRLDQLGRDHPVRPLPRQRRPREDHEPRPARALVLAAALVAQPQVRQQAREHRAVHVVGLGRRAVELHADPLRCLAQLLDEVLPLADPQVVQELGQAALAELVAGELALALAQVPPQVQVGDEVRALVGEPGVRLVGLRGLVAWPLARVLDRQRGSDDDHLGRAAQPIGLEHHPAHPRVDRQVGQAPPQLRQPAANVERAELLEQRDPVAHLAPVRRVDEREVLDVAETGRGHLQDHRRQARALDLRIGEARARRKIVLLVETDADALGDASAAALALVGRRLRDRLDRQPLDLQPRAVAADPRRPRVDDVVDAGHGQRRLRDVRGQHDPPLRGAPEHALLLGRGQARVQRQHLGPTQPSLQHIGRVADLPLAGQEYEHVAGALALQLLDGVGDRVLLVAIGVLDRPVAHLDRVHAAGHLDHRRVPEVLAESLRVDRRRRDDQLQLRPPREDPVDGAEQEVDVEAALVRFVDDDRVIAAQQPVAAHLGQQQPVGHQPDARVRAGAVVEADGVSDRVAERHVQFLGDPRRDRARRQAPRLRVRDPLALQLEAQLGQLRRLARAGFAGHDDHLVVADDLQQLVPSGADRQLRRVRDGGHHRQPATPSPTRAAFSSIASSIRGHALRGRSWPRPSISTSRAPGIAFAVALPPETGTSLSAVPWMTTVGAVIVRSSGVRSPDAMIAASWRVEPAGFRPRS
jgi:hypothetical protein